MVGHPSSGCNRPPRQASPVRGFFLGNSNLPKDSTLTSIMLFAGSDGSHSTTSGSAGKPRMSSSTSTEGAAASGEGSSNCPSSSGHVVLPGSNCNSNGMSPVHAGGVYPGALWRAPIIESMFSSISAPPNNGTIWDTISVGGCPSWKGDGPTPCCQGTTFVTIAPACGSSTFGLKMTVTGVPSGRTRF